MDRVSAEKLLIEAEIINGGEEKLEKLGLGRAML